MKVLRWDAASSLERPENCSFITRFSKAALISYDSALVVGAIGVLIKSLLLVLEKSQSLVFSAVMTSTNKQAHKQARKPAKENDKRKKAKENGKGERQMKMANVKWGRGKREATGKKGKCKR